MFLSDGFDAVAMEQVAAIADISKGTLYARYPSKEALFSAVVEASVQDWSQEAARSDHLLTDDIEQRLRYHAQTIATALLRPDVQGIQRLILSVRSRFPELAASMHERGYGYIVGLIAADIAAAAQRDARCVRDPRAVAQMLVAGISGYQMQEEEEESGGPADLPVFAQRLVDVLLCGRDAW